VAHDWDPTFAAIGAQNTPDWTAAGRDIGENAVESGHPRMVRFFVGDLFVYVINDEPPRDLRSAVESLR